MNHRSLWTPTARPAGTGSQLYCSAQRGAALFVSLMLLLVLTLIGLSAANVGLMQERMAGNVREHNVAFQSAEAALRGIERRIPGFILTGGGIDNVQYWIQFLNTLGVSPNDCALATVAENASFDSLPWKASPDVPGARYLVIELSGTMVGSLPTAAACAPIEGQYGGKPIEQARHFVIFARAPGPAQRADVVVQSIYFWPI